MATVQTIVRSNRYLVASTYFSTIERSGIQLRSGEFDLLQRQYGGPRQCPQFIERRREHCIGCAARGPDSLVLG